MLHLHDFAQDFILKWIGYVRLSFNELQTLAQRNSMTRNNDKIVAVRFCEVESRVVTES